MNGTKLTITTPDDWHVHLRDDHMLAAVTPHTARTFQRALVMPNLADPITSTAAAVVYRDRVLAAAGPDALPEFTPLMTLYLNNSVDLDDLRAGHRDGVVFAAKYYPAGATTNSDAGGGSLMSYLPVLEGMADSKIPLLVHAESTEPTIDIFDRERAFLDAELALVCAALPELAITVEHVSTAAGIDFVLSHDGVAGSITPHHLSCDRSDLLANGLRPDLYCKPVINSRSDRLALVAAATSGDSNFFLGTDSAPHPLGQKHAEVAKPGIFNAPYAVPVVAEAFAAEGSLGHLEAFMSLNGARHYGVRPSASTIELRRQGGVEQGVKETVTTDAGEIVTIFGVGAGRAWSVEPV